MSSEINSEADVKREVKKLLTKYGWFYWMPAGSAYGQNNVDFNCVRNGKILAIETKYKNNVLTVNQKIFLDAIRDAGGQVFVCYETNLHELEMLLTAL